MTDAMTRLTGLLGIDHPIVLGPFGGLSSVELTAAVSELGGRQPEQSLIGSISLIPQVVDAVTVPVIAAGASPTGAGSRPRWRSAQRACRSARRSCGRGSRRRPTRTARRSPRPLLTRRCSRVR